MVMMSFNPDESLPAWCNRTAFLFRALFDQRAEALGLKWAEGVILLKLGMGHNTLAELARHLEHSHPAILRHVDKLEEAGLVIRTGHPDDRRIKTLVLTESGNEKLRELRKMAATISHEMNEQFGKERVAQVIALMKEIAGAYGGLTPNGCPIFAGQEHQEKQADHD